jgi:hypothetical protein
LPVFCKQVFKTSFVDINLVNVYLTFSYFGSVGAVRVAVVVVEIVAVAVAKANRKSKPSKLNSHMCILFN